MARAVAREAVGAEELEEEGGEVVGEGGEASRRSPWRGDWRR